MSDIYKNTSFTKNEIQSKKEATSIEHWGTSHPMKSDEMKNKLKDIFVEKYGVDNPSKDPAVIERIRQVSIEKYGVDNPSKDPAVIERIRQKSIERWSNPEYKKSMLDKRKKTNMEKYGVEWNSQRPEHKELTNKTSNERYGTDWPMQNDAIHDRSTNNSKLLKEYKFSSGRVEKIQGYESWAIDVLLKTYHEDELILRRGSKPRIKYRFMDKDLIYKPDIYIPKDNLLIEVKSNYTYNTELEKNLAKEKASIAAGYNFRFMIFDKHGRLLNDN